MTCLSSIKIAVGAGHYHVFQDMYSYLSFKVFVYSISKFVFVGGFFMFLLLWFKLVKKCQHFSSEGKRE